MPKHFITSPPLPARPFNKNKPPPPLSSLLPHLWRNAPTGSLVPDDVKTYRWVQKCGISYDGPTSPRPQSIPAVTRWPSRRRDPPTKKPFFKKKTTKKHFVRRLHIKPYCFLTPLSLVFCSYLLLLIHVVFRQLYFQSKSPSSPSSSPPLPRLFLMSKFVTAHNTGSSVSFHANEKEPKSFFFFFSPFM